MRGFVAILLILIYLSVIIAQGDVDIPVIPGGGGGSSSGGGGHSYTDIDNFIRQVESWSIGYNTVSTIVRERGLFLDCLSYE